MGLAVAGFKVVEEQRVAHDNFPVMMLVHLPGIRTEELSVQTFLFGDQIANQTPGQRWDSGVILSAWQDGSSCTRR